MGGLTDKDKETIESKLSKGETISRIAEEMSLHISEIIAYRVSEFEKNRPPQAKYNEPRRHAKELEAALRSMKRVQRSRMASGNRYIGIMKIIAKRNDKGVESGSIRQYLSEEGRIEGVDYGVQSLTGGELRTLMKNYLVYCCLSEPKKYFINNHGRDLLDYLERNAQYK